MPSVRRRPSPLPLALTMLLALPAAAQCEPYWLPGDAVGDPVGGVDRVVAWDPDGAGPSGLVLVAGGEFAAGPHAHLRVAMHDGTAWSPVGAPPAGRVTGLTVWSGQLVAAFEASSSTAVVAAFDGSAWVPFGTFQGSARVDVFTVYQGTLVAGGRFTTANGVAANGVASWNGTTWSPLGAGITSGTVHALAVFNGSLHAGGDFTVAGGATVGRYAIWNGSAWAPAATFNGVVRTLVVRNGTSLANSFLFAGGDFGVVNLGANQVSTPRVARFTPTTNSWSAVGNVGDPCAALVVRSTGLTSYQLAAAVNGPFGSSVATWNGTSWSPVASSSEQRFDALAYFAGGWTVGTSGGIGQGAVRRAVGSTWTIVGGPGSNTIARAVLDGGTDVVLGGSFGVLRGGPGAWSTFGGGVTGTVTELARLANGDLIAAGSLTHAGGIPVGAIARWNGSAWSPLGGGVSGVVHALLPLPDGSLVVGGGFGVAAGGAPSANVARWTGGGWQPLAGGVDAPVNALVQLPGGDVVAGGAFTQAGGFGSNARYVARWNGTSWSAMTSGAGFDQPVAELALTAAGELLAGGAFTSYSGAPMSGLARWNGGTSWSAVPSPGFIARVRALPNGDLLANSGGTTLLRCRGPVFEPLLVDEVGDFALAANGDVLVAGGTMVVGELVSQGFARLTTPCPATAAAAGAGCAGDVLAAASLPWAGSTFRALGTGLPAAAFVLVATGFGAVNPPLPLAGVLPQALPGCSLLVTPDLVDALVTLTGTATSQLALPNTVALAGTTFHQQLVSLQVDAALAITAVTATNALQLTIGVL